ncbi:MAG TPA: porin family protein [Ferruginibacter sp.]|nr:porin family protein [Ferruginibacter sp.]
MKWLFSCLCLFLALYTFAQNEYDEVERDHENFFRAGIKGGVNINKITGQTFRKGFNYNFQLGGFLQFNFSPILGIQPEVNFVQGSSEFTDDATSIYDDIFRDGSQKKARLNYLEIPVLLNLDIGTTQKIKLQGGPSYGALLKQTVDSLRSGSTIYKNGEWSLIGGLWMQLPLINFGARYKYGLSNINGIDNRQTWRNQSIQIFLGLTF